MQNILNIKEKMEEMEKMNFAEMRLKLTEEENKLEELMRRKEEIELEAKKLRNEKIDILKIKENTSLMEYLDSSIKTQTLRVRAAEKNLDIARKKMTVAVQERQIQEKLRENALDEFMKEENAAELKEIDQLTSFTFGQKNRV